MPALAGTWPPCPDRWTPSEIPSCPCCQPVFNFFWVKKAYMSNDANHVSNLKER